MKWMLFFAFMFFGWQTVANDKITIDSLPKENLVLFNVLLSDDYQNKTKLINQINKSYLLNKLKSAAFQYELDTIYTQRWNENSELPENYFRYNYDFENNGKRVIVKIFSWNKDEVGWRIADVAYYDFNEGGFLQVAEFHHYIGFLYRTFSKIEYTYTENLINNETFFEKTDEEDAWKKLSQTVYKYDSTGWLSTVYTNNWEDYDETWIYKNKVEYLYYREDGELKTETGFDYEFYERYWIPKYKTEYKKDSLGRINEISEFVVGLGNSSFLEVKRILKQYDTNNKLKAKTLYEYDYDADDFLPVLKTEFFADVSANTLFYEEEYFWSLEEVNWVMQKTTSYKTLNQLVKDDILYHDFIEVHFPLYLFNEKVCEQIEEQRQVENTWVNGGNTFYRFTRKLPVEISSISGSKIRIFPVPAKNILNVVLSEPAGSGLYLFDISGRLVLQQNELLVQNQIDVSGLQEGIYFLQLKQKGSLNFSKKISIQR